MKGLNYRTYLEIEFARRKRVNTRYSLRSYARDLGIAPSQLCNVLQAKEGISTEVGEKFSARLRLTQAEKAIFVASVASLHGKTAAERERAKLRLKQNQSDALIDMAAFSLVADWEHFAVLEYLELAKASSKPAEIARHFGLKEERVKQVLGNLEKCGLLRHAAGELKPQTKNTFTPTEVSEAAIRYYHKQLLQLAAEKIESVPVAKRDFRSMTFSFDEAVLPALKEEVSVFLERIGNLARRSQKKNTVYALNVQTIPLTQVKIGEKP